MSSQINIEKMVNIDCLRQRLHAINLADGTDHVTPYLLGDTTGTNTNNSQIYVYGTGDGSVTDPYHSTGKTVVLIGGVLSTEAYFNGKLYAVSGCNDVAKELTINSDGTLTVASQTTNAFGSLVGSPSVSASGTTNGIVWIMDRQTNELHAYDAVTYKIYRGTVSGAGILLQSGVTVTSFIDSTGVVGTKYFYAITAVNTNVKHMPVLPTESVMSSEVSATPFALVVSDYIKGSGKAVHLVQAGATNVIFIDSTGHMSLGTLINPTQATTPDFPSDVATFSNDRSTVTWTDGTVWTQAAPTSAITVTNDTNQNGVAVRLIQNGTNQLAFIDGRGRISLGTLTSPTTAAADLYPDDVATISGNTITWQDGFVWTVLF